MCNHKHDQFKNCSSPKTTLYRSAYTDHFPPKSTCFPRRPQQSLMYFSLYGLDLPILWIRKDSYKMWSFVSGFSYLANVFRLHPCCSVQFSSVQSLSRVQLFTMPWIAACQASLSITNSWSLFRLMSIELLMPSSHLILYHPLLLLPPIPPSIRVFSNESTLCMRWPKYWSFSFSISPSNEHPELIFRMNWLDLLGVQGTLSLLQHHSSKASILQCSAFFRVQRSHPYMNTGKIKS